GLAKKGKSKGSPAPDPDDTGPGRLHNLVERVAWPVGQLLALEVAPERLHGIELGGIGGEALHGEPGSLRGDEGRHGLAAMRRKAIPEQGDPLALELAAELGEELYEGGVVVGPGSDLKHEPGGGAVGSVGEGRRHGGSLPVEGAPQDGGLAPGSPGAPDRRGQADSQLVAEDDPRPPAPGVFFTWGQRVFTQPAIASSSRPAARRAGRWRLQSMERRIFQTWPTW